MNNKKLTKNKNKNKNLKNIFFNRSRIFKSFLTILISVLMVFTIVKAGTLIPPSGAPSAQFYTLSEIYEFITNNTTATEGDHDFTFSDGLSATHHTLADIYDALASLITANTVKLGTTYLGVAGTLVPDDGDALAENVLSGKTFFGDSQADWDLQTGTMPNNGEFSLIASTTDQSITTGYYSGGTLSGDADLIASNIASGVNIFGVIGELVAGYVFGDTDASKVLTSALGAGTYNASNLIASTVKKGISFGVSEVGTYIGYPGSGWTGGTTIDQTTCDAQNDNGWYWFEDGNGDGDTDDPEDGVCIKTTTVNSDSWNGAEQVGPTAITAQEATAGTANSITKDSAGWTVDAYANAVVKITSGTASGCWGVIKSNTADTITVYGSWLDSGYASDCGTPDATSVFDVRGDGFALYDISWIGDYTCTGSWPTGTVVHHDFPTSGTVAIETADCYDGVRDLLPNETDRAVITGTATSADASSVTDTSLALNTNAWVGQKVLITGGTGSGSHGRIESNTATAITIDAWSGDAPAVDSTFAIIYLIPHATYNPNTDVTGGDNDALNGNNGPLTAEVLNNWQGTRLPSSSDFFGFCGSEGDGSPSSAYSTNGTSDKTYGDRGGQVGRTDECIDLANSVWEWLSEQHSDSNARIAGKYACSNFSNLNVNGGIRFRAVFRP